MWSGVNLKLVDFDWIQSYQKVSQIPKISELTKKHNLFLNLSAMQSIHGIRSFNFMPRSFLLPKDAGPLLDEMSRDKHRVWIFKPVSSCQGNGIFLMSAINCKNFADIYLKNNLPRQTNLIASHYIQNPMLLS